MTLAIALGLVVSCAAPPACQYQSVDLGEDVSPTDINNLGTVVGSRQAGTTRIAIRYASGGLQDLAGGRVANAVNDHDLITGGDINELDMVAGSKAGCAAWRAWLRC